MIHGGIMSEFTCNQCKTCGGNLLYNQNNSKYICEYCGNQYTLNENNDLQQITKKDLDKQTTKILDDIKTVVDAIIKDTNNNYNNNESVQRYLEERVKKAEKNKKLKNNFLKVLFGFYSLGILILIVTIFYFMFGNFEYCSCGCKYANQLFGCSGLLASSLIPTIISYIKRKKQHKSVKFVVIVGIVILLIAIAGFVAVPIKNYILRNYA